MTVADIASIVASIGFPCAACIAMGWYVKYSTDQNNKRIDNLQAQHREENKQVVEAINNNTIALTKLCEKMEG